MNYRMAYIYLDTDSSSYNFRVRTPSDVLRILDDDRLLLAFGGCLGEPGFDLQARIGAVVKFSLRTSNAAVAVIRKNQALAQLAKVWAAKRSEPQQLDFMQIMGSRASYVNSMWSRFSKSLTRGLIGSRTRR